MDHTPARKKGKKAVQLGLVTGALAVVLAGCGATPKSEYTKAHETLAKANTLEQNVSLGMNLKDSGNPEDAEMAALLNSLELNANVKSDKKAEQHEVDLGIKANMGPMKISLDVPMLLDEKTGKVFTKAEAYTDIMSVVPMFMGFPMQIQTPDSLKGKVVEVDTSDKPELSDKQKKEQEQLTTDLTDALREYVNKIPDKDFTKDGDTIVFSVNGAGLIDSMLDVLAKHPEALPEDADLSDIKKSFKENVTVGQVAVKAVLKSGKLTQETFAIPMTVTTEDGSKTELTIKAVTKYAKINEKLDFTFDLDKKNVITQEQYEQLLGEAMSEGVSFDGDPSGMDGVTGTPMPELEPSSGSDGK